MSYFRAATTGVEVVAINASRGFGMTTTTEGATEGSQKAAFQGYRHSLLPASLESCIKLEHLLSQFQPAYSFALRYLRPS